MLRLTALSRKHKTAIAYLITSSIIWGAAGPIVKYTLWYIPPITFLFLRFLFASIVVLPFLILEQKNKPVDKRDFVNLAILGFLGGTLSLIFTFYGFMYTTALDATLLSSISTLVTIWASHKFLGEDITEGQRKGAIFALIGTLIVTGEPLLETGLGHGNSISRFIGNLFIILSILVWTAYMLWSKKILNHIPYKMGFIFHALHLRSTMKSYSPFFLTGVLCVVSLITLAPLAVLELSSISSGTTAFGMEQKSYSLDFSSPDMLLPILGVLFMGLFSTLVAYGMYEWALKVVPVAESAIYGYLSLLFAIPFSYLILGEKIGTTFVLGGALIAFGVYISEKKQTR